MESLLKSLSDFWENYKSFFIRLGIVAAIILVALGCIYLLCKLVVKKIQKKAEEIKEMKDAPYWHIDRTGIVYEYRDWDHVTHQTTNRFMAETMNTMSSYSDPFPGHLIDDNTPGHSYSMAEVFECPNVFDTLTVKQVFDNASDCIYARLYTDFSGKYGMEQFHTCVGPQKNSFNGFYGQSYYSWPTEADSQEKALFQQYVDGLFKKFANRKIISPFQNQKNQKYSELEKEKDIFGVAWADMKIDDIPFYSLSPKKQLEAKNEFRRNNKKQMTLNDIEFILQYIGYSKNML